MLSRTSLYLLFISLLLLLSFAQAQVVVPDFSTRGDVPPEVAGRFMDAFRQQLAARTELEVSAGSIFAPPPKGGVDPEVATAVATLADERYGLTGEIIASRGALSEETPYTVNLLMVDTQTGERSDLLSEPLSTRDYLGAVAELTGALSAFINPGNPLSSGSASLFISSQPRRAQIHIDGAYVGDTSEVGLISLAPGRYSVELRKDGFVPEIDTLTLEVNHTEFVNFELMAIRSGSVQVTSTPVAEVFLDDESIGTTPLTMSADPGVRTLRLERPGFVPETQEVRVRNFFVSRVSATLEPRSSALLYWTPPAGFSVAIDSEPRERGFVSDLPPGPHRVELRRGVNTIRFTLEVPASGVFEIDFQSRSLVPLEESP